MKRRSAAKELLNYKASSRENFLTREWPNYFYIASDGPAKPVKVSLRYGQSKLAVYSYVVQLNCPASPGAQSGHEQCNIARARTAAIRVATSRTRASLGTGNAT